MDVPNSNFSFFDQKYQDFFSTVMPLANLEKPGEKTAEPINQAASRLQAAETPTMAGPNCGARNPGHHAATLAGGGSEHGGAGVGEGEVGEEEAKGEKKRRAKWQKDLFFFFW